MLSKGIDISKWQGMIDYNKLGKESDLEFIICRASRDNTSDRLFSRNWDRMEDYSYYRGAYHLMDYSVDISLQVERYLKTVNGAGGFGDLDFPPILDLEYSKLKEVTPEVAYYGIIQWCTEIMQATNMIPMLYISKRDCNYLKNYNELLNCFFLWLVDYSFDGTGDPPRMIDHWEEYGWDFCQYSSTGPGKDWGMESDGLDLDYFNSNKWVDITNFIELSRDPEQIRLVSNRLAGKEELFDDEIEEILEYNRKQEFTAIFNNILISKYKMRLFDEQDAVKKVMEFQRKHNLTVDGKLGPDTKNKMLGC